MRVCIAVRALPMHRPGGLEYHAWDLAHALVALGCQVTVVTSGLGAGAMEKRATPGSFDMLSDSPGLRIHLLKGTTPGDYNRRFFRCLEAYARQQESIGAYDVFHSQEFAGLFLGNRIRNHVVTVHGTMTSEIPLYPEYFRHLSRRGKLAALWKYKARLALVPAFNKFIKSVPRMIVDSDFTRRELLKISPESGDRIHLVPLGLDYSRYRLDAQPALPAGKKPAAYDDVEPLRIALLGRVQKMKGLAVAVAAADILDLQGVPFEMHIAGKGDFLNELRATVLDLELTKQVFIHGLVPDEELSPFLRYCDVFLFPDLTQPAFGLVAIEAMAHGLPVVGSRSGAIPEVVQDAVGWIYTPWDPEDLASRLTWLATNRAELKQKSEVARAYAELFTAERMARSVLQVYDRMVS